MGNDHFVVGYIPGVFDMFHIGHLNIIRRSRERCDWLIAGVVNDETVEEMKGHPPIVPLGERMEIVAANRYVDRVIEARSADKREAWNECHFNVVFKGSDWVGTHKGRRLEAEMSEVGVRVEYLPYTETTSSTLLRETLQEDRERRVTGTQVSGLDQDRSARPQSFRQALDALSGAQKTSKGAPAYSRYVNRPLGRVFAAAAYTIGRTPNQVTLISAVFTFTGVGLIALVRPTWIVSLVVVTTLVIGYALDSADGQLARLRGGGSATGEWLDHTVDAFKIGVLHLVVLVSWFRFEEQRGAWLLIPLGFQAVATVQFFSILLMDQLRRAHRGTTKTIMKSDGTSSPIYSLAVVPTDFGLLCLVLGLMFAATPFRVVYTAVFVANAAFLLLALPKWYREVGGFGRIVGDSPGSATTTGHTHAEG